MIDLQIGNPYPLRVLGVIAAGTYQNEGLIHRHFEDSRMQGEWFRYSARLQSFIKRYCTGYTLGNTFEKVRPLPRKYGLNSTNARHQIALTADGVRSPAAV
jgi:hypothetical protein